MNPAQRSGSARSISLLIGSTVALGLALPLLLAGCSGNSSVTCDEYAAMELFKQGGALGNTITAHGLDEFNVKLSNAVEYQVNDFCGGPFKPQGGDRARKNGSRPFDEGVIWSKLGQ